MYVRDTSIAVGRRTPSRNQELYHGYSYRETIEVKMQSLELSKRLQYPVALCTA